MPLGCNADKPVGDFANALLEPRLSSLPGGASEAVQEALIVTVTAEKLDVLDRQVQLVTASVFEVDALVRRTESLDDLQALVAARRHVPRERSGPRG